jgi:poly-gamma-glutamate system protein
MSCARRTSFLVVALLVSVLVLLAVREYGTTVDPHPDAPRMHEAALLADRWFTLIEKKKAAAGIISPDGSGVRHGGMLGQEFSEITTTLGSLEAKEVALNPDFAALMVRLLDEAGVDSSSTVGVMLSGSFPTLGISTLAALQTVGAKALVLSSLGASMYGANQPGATWIDMEQWLQEGGGLNYRSVLVTMGGEGDAGGGLPEEGLAVLRSAAQRSRVPLYVPSTLQDAIRKRTEMLQANKIDLLINIGGNQASLGGCVHGATIPNGYHDALSACNDPGRGVVVRMAERGIPVIHVLNIRDLAVRYGVQMMTPDSPDSVAGVYRTAATKRTIVSAGLVTILGMLAAFRMRRSEKKEGTG